MSDGNGNGNGNGKQIGLTPFADQGFAVPIRGADSENVADPVLNADVVRLLTSLKQELAEAKGDLARVNVVCLVQGETIDKLLVIVGEISKEIASLRLGVEKMTSSLAAENQRYHDREIDHHILKPFLLFLIGMIDRMCTEIPGIEQMVMQFSAIENARHIDRQEMLQHLATYGVEQYGVQTGVRFDSVTQTIQRTKQVDALKVGRVTRMLRHGYRRGDWIIRPAWVEVGIQQSSQRS